MQRKSRWIFGVGVALLGGAFAQVFFTFTAVEYAARTHNTFTTLHVEPRFGTFAVRYDWEDAPNNATRASLSVGWPMLWLVSEKNFEADPPIPGTILLRPTWAYPHAAVPGLSRGWVQPVGFVVNSLVFAVPLLIVLLLWIRFLGRYSSSSSM